MEFYFGTAFIALVNNFSSKWHRYIDRLIELIKLISFRQIDGRLESTRNHQDLSFVDHYNYSKTNIKIISLEWHKSQMTAHNINIKLFYWANIYLYPYRCANSNHALNTFTMFGCIYGFRLCNQIYWLHYVYVSARLYLVTSFTEILARRPAHCLFGFCKWLIYCDHKIMSLLYKLNALKVRMWWRWFSWICALSI